MPTWSIFFKTPPSPERSTMEEASLWNGESCQEKRERKSLNLQSYSHAIKTQHLDLIFLHTDMSMTKKP